ncbi:YcaO-like family protein [Microbacterium tumbae]
MTRLAVHALGDDRMVVCADDGRRWTIDAPAALIDDEAVRDALSALRGPEADAVIVPPADDATILLTCLGDLARLAATVTAPTTAQWTFAGRMHRVLLRPGDAASVAREVTACLLATVADAEEARGLAARPLVDEISGARPARRPPAEGMLERWADGAWHPHRLDPPPLVDAVTGILRRIVERPRDPQSPPEFVHLHAELPHLSSIDGRFRPDPLAPAGGFRGAATPPEHEAILSGVAHECGAYLGQGVRRAASAAELRLAGERVLTVTEWRPHDPRLHEMPGFPFVRDDPALRTTWLRGEDAQGACWVPLSLVHAGYLASRLDDLPPTNGHNLVGLQAGFTRAEALDRAAAHLIAQDAVARWWSGGSRLAETPLPAVARWEQSPWRVRVMAVPSRFGMPVRLAVVDDPAEGVVALGHGCAQSPSEAAARALSEALVQHASARDLLRPDSLIRDAAALGNGGVAGLAPYDARRRYADAFSDRRRMIDPMCHLQYGLDPEAVDHTRRRLEPSGVEAEATAPPSGSPFAALTRGCRRVVRVDVTTRRVRDAGASAVRVLAPDLARLSVAAFDGSESSTAHPYPGW